MSRFTDRRRLIVPPTRAVTRIPLRQDYTGFPATPGFDRVEPAADDPLHMVPADDASKTAISVAPIGPKPQNLIIMDRRAVRTTAIIYPEQFPGALFLPGMRSWGFDIDNQCDQTLTWQLIGGSYPDPTQQGLVGASGGIAANTLEPLLTNVWARYLSVYISFAVAPTVGTVNIKAWADPNA